jgi:hypothetical protein
VSSVACHEKCGWLLLDRGERWVKSLPRIFETIPNLLAEEGIGSHELGYFYGVLMSHVRVQMLEGKTVGTASVEQLRHALNRRHRIASNFRTRPGLVTSIIKYKPEAEHAKQ